MIYALGFTQGLDNSCLPAGGADVQLDFGGA